MSLKGGYKIINFNGISLSGTPVTMADVLVNLKENVGKVVLLSNVVLGDAVMNECFSTPLSDGDDGFKLNAYDGYIAVTKAGAVTYTVAAESSIPSLISDVNAIKSNVILKANTIATMEDLKNIISSNDNNFIYPVTLSQDIVNAAFGINYTATAILRRISSTSADLIVFPATTSYIAVGRYNKNTDAWSYRYIFTGTEYTPTP